MNKLEQVKAGWCGTQGEGTVWGCGEGKRREREMVREKEGKEKEGKEKGKVKGRKKEGKERRRKEKEKGRKKKSHPWSVCFQFYCSLMVCK